MLVMRQGLMSDGRYSLVAARHGENEIKASYVERSGLLLQKGKEPCRPACRQLLPWQSVLPRKGARKGRQAAQLSACSAFSLPCLWLLSAPPAEGGKEEERGSRVLVGVGQRSWSWQRFPEPEQGRGEILGQTLLVALRLLLGLLRPRES